MVVRNRGVAMHAQSVLEQAATKLALVGGVHDLSDDRDAGEFADPICLAQNLVSNRDAFTFETCGFRAQHQMRKIDIPLVWRHIWAFRHVAHVAQVAMINDVPIDRLRNCVQFHALRLVNRIEQCWKRIAQVEAAATAVTNIEHALEFIEEFGLVVKLVALPVERMASGSLKTPLAIADHVSRLVSRELFGNGWRVSVQP